MTELNVRIVVNLSLMLAGGTLLALAPAYAQISAAEPIPEPASWAIMAVGIGAVAMAARRRQRK